jgi:hypothetical protein
MSSLPDLHILDTCSENSCKTYRNFKTLSKPKPVTVAERSKACTVFAHSEAGTMGLNPTQGIDV